MGIVGHNTVETTVVSIEREKGGGVTRLCNKKRRSHDFPSSHGLTRHSITATSPAYITPCGQPYQIWKDAPTNTVKVQRVMLYDHTSGGAAGNLLTFHRAPYQWHHSIEKRAENLLRHSAKLLAVP